MQRSFWIAMVSAMALFAGLAGAQTIYSSLGPGETAAARPIPGLTVGGGVLRNDPPGNAGAMGAQSFVTTASATLQRVDAVVKYRYIDGIATGPDDLDLTLAADRNGLPGDAIETIHLTGVMGGIQNAVAVVAARSVQHPVLRAQTRYWIVLAPPDLLHSAFEWLPSPQKVAADRQATRVGRSPWYPAYSPPLAVAVFGGVEFAPQPSISTNGVVDGASLRAVISPGAWTTVFGESLAPLTRPWQESDFHGEVLPVSLEGVSVQIGGNLASVSYVSSTQVNVQAPDDLSLQPLTVQVITAAGPSKVALANSAQSAPAFFTLGTAPALYVAAVLPDGTLAGRPGLVTGRTSRAVRPGEIIALYGSSLGVTTPVVPAGTLVHAAAPLSDLNGLVVGIGGQNAVIQFAGLVGPGLYQINVVVPDVPDGDQPLTAWLYGQPTQDGVFLTVGRANP